MNLMGPRMDPRMMTANALRKPVINPVSTMLESDPYAGGAMGGPPMMDGAPISLSPERLAAIHPSRKPTTGIVSSPTLTTAGGGGKTGGGGGAGKMVQMGPGTALMTFLDAIGSAKSGEPMKNSQFGKMRFGRDPSQGDPSRGLAGGTGVFAYGVPKKQFKMPNKKA